VHFHGHGGGSILVKNDSPAVEQLEAFRERTEDPCALFANGFYRVNPPPVTGDAEFYRLCTFYTVLRSSIIPTARFDEVAKPLDDFLAEEGFLPKHAPCHDGPTRTRLYSLATSTLFYKISLLHDLEEDQPGDTNVIVQLGLDSRQGGVQIVFHEYRSGNIPSPKLLSVVVEDEIEQALAEALGAQPV
jgi:hypothetical protein